MEPEKKAVSPETPMAPQGSSSRDVCPGAEKKKKVSADFVSTDELLAKSAGPRQLTRAEFDEAREKLAKAEGPEFWRSLEELARSEAFQQQLQREFPNGASEWLGGEVSRRGFLKLMSASMALAGLTACTRHPSESIVPYVRQPEEIIPGKSMFYASAFPMNGHALPVLVKSNMGRPTKIEGNPEHPATMGGSDIFMQAAVLDLYDPDRSATILYGGETRPWGSFLSALRGQLRAQTAAQGGQSGLRILTQNICSPSFAAQIRTILAKYPGAKWYQYEAVNRDNVRNGAIMAFGQDVDSHYNIADADVILSLEADFLNSGFPGQLRYAREYASRRRPKLPNTPTPGIATATLQELPIRPMNRMYMIESAPTPTGAKADHRLPVRASEVEQYARMIATRLGVNAGEANAGAAGASPKTDFENKFIDAVVKDLQAHRGTSVVIAGQEQPPVVHALAHAINNVLGNVGKTVSYSDPVVLNPAENLADIRTLADEMRGGKVDLLVIMHGNPVYDAPADVNFAEAMGKVQAVVQYALATNETTEHCHWHVNASHPLESWGDARAVDGTVSIIQPLIAPLYNTKSDVEFLAAFTDQPDLSGYDIVRGYWQSQQKGGDFEAWWRKAVHDGFVANSALPTRTMTAKTAFPEPTKPPELEVVIRRDPSVWDGRFANNGWLQELPKPMTKVTWDNPALVGPKYAERNKLKTLDVIEVEANGKKEKFAIWVTPGHPDNSVTLFMGYGRMRAGRVGTGVGANVFPLRTSAQPFILSGAKVRPTGSKYQLASTQGWQNMEGRAIVRRASLEEYEKEPHFAKGEEPQAPQAEGLTLLPSYEYKDHKWGMSIDQNACVGCNACVVACQAENNVPVVGKLEVQRGRHMHWLRVDVYYEGDPANPNAYFQPVPCMHCENAPCEIVCPVAATVHSSEGLNDMVYNRCVGTRYCSNNCPYKVRRFNFLLYSDWDTPQLKMLNNPDVSIRPRGVMEKCTYCVQRITGARITAEREDRKVRDGELMTACQQACPADAIVFGDLNDSSSRLVKLKNDPRDYGLLTDLNTMPRTTYLAVVRNPNPEIPEPERA